jgi:hypothetical protein
MKPSLPTEELIEHWTLLPHERTWVLDSVRDHNRLGFAVLLKFFQRHARFPSERRE